MAESLVQLLELGVAIVAICSFAILVLAFGYAASIPVVSPTQRPSWWARHYRPGGAVVSAIVAVALGIVWAPVLLPAAGPEPLEAFGPAAGSGSIYAGTDSNGQFIYLMANEGVLEYTFNLGNAGGTRITVVDASAADYWLTALASGVALVPAESAGQVEQAVGPKTSPFSIDGGSSRPVTLVVRFRRCPAEASVPTLAPGTSPSVARARGVGSDYSSGGGISALSVTYTNATGQTTTMTLTLPSNVQVRGNDLTSCLNTLPSGS